MPVAATLTTHGVILYAEQVRGLSSECVPPYEQQCVMIAVDVACEKAPFLVGCCLVRGDIDRMDKMKEKNLNILTVVMKPASDYRLQA